MVVTEVTNIYYDILVSSSVLNISHAFIHLILTTTSCNKGYDSPYFQVRIQRSRQGVVRLSWYSEAW